MTTENLKAVLIKLKSVLTEDEWDTFRVVLDELVKDESLEFTLGPGIRTITLHQLNNIKNMLFRLADEVVRLAETHQGLLATISLDRDHIRELEASEANAVYMFEQEKNRADELEAKLKAKLKAWEDAPMVEVSGQALVDYTGDYALDGTYHLKPAEADDAQGN